MKVKRFISRLALVAVAALFVHAASAEEEVLYFMVDAPTFDDGSKPDYSYVMVALSDGGTPPNPSGDYLTLYGGGGTAQGSVLDAGSTAPVYVGLGKYSTTDSILFELWFESPEDSWERVAYHSANISDLSAHIGSSTNPSATPYSVHDVMPVPEPTSGLLVLLGFAGLALRRKRI